MGHGRPCFVNDLDWYPFLLARNLKGDAADLVSLREMCLETVDLNVSESAAAVVVGSDLDTEQLLSEIEQLTSRALQETNQVRRDGVVWYTQYLL